MKIYCNRTELNKALNNVSHSVPVRTTSNILEGILINVEDNKMKLTSTDTNMTTETTINVNSDGICEFVVPAKLFSAIIANLSRNITENHSGITTCQNYLSKTTFHFTEFTNRTFHFYLLLSVKLLAHF